ncbi:MAG: serine hydrolase domain-containing protein [Halioglobus sp.]
MPEFSFSSELLQDLARATPGMKILAIKGGDEVLFSEFGETYLVYDLASLTKIIFTVTAVMLAEDKGLLDSEDFVHKHLEWFPAKTIRISHLLAHHSGLAQWLPVYEQLRERNLVGRNHYPQNWEVVKEMIISSPITKYPAESVYSDLDFWMLGFILEHVFGQSLHSVWQSLNLQMGLKETDFNVGNDPLFSSDEYAPTENCPWRSKVLCGEVHDENTWALGGVCSHAGLFGSIENVGKWATGLRDAFYGGSWVIHPETVKKYAKQTGPGFWTLGFMQPSVTDSAAGSKISRNAIGHWGYTGTGLWFDPDNDLVIASVSNRVHPTRENVLFPKLRPRIHDEIYSFLGY